MMQQDEQKDPLSPGAFLLAGLHGLWIARAIQIAAELGIADELRDGPADAKDLASVTKTDQASLYRLLRALASIGIFAEVSPARFQNTERSCYLQSDHPGSLRAIARLWGKPVQLRIIEDLPYSISTGESAFVHLNEINLWQYLDSNPDIAQIFHASMTNLSHAINEQVVLVYDFAHFSTLIDVGGGLGSLLSTILKHFPSLQKGILFDQETVVAQAKTSIEAEVQARCEFIGGSFFESVPSGGDAYILKQILHDYPDAGCIQILSHCRKAMNAGAHLLIIERVLQPVIGEVNHPLFSSSVTTQQINNLFFDLHMLATFGSMERTEEQFAHLLDAAGFSLNRVIKTASSACIVEAIAH